MKYLSTIVCPLCESGSHKILYKSTLKKEDFTRKSIKENLKNSLANFTKHSQIVRCSSCGLVYSNPRENIDKLLSGYEDVVDKEYLVMEKYRKMLSKKHIAKIKKYKKKGLILDIGCFCGFFLELAKKNGYEPFGVEPSRWARTIARKKGVKIIGKTSHSITKNKFDIVTMWDVVEHLPDPKSELKKVSKLLKKDGILAIGTPNIESVLAKIFKNKHPFLIRMHIVLFSPKTLKRMLENSGFTSVYMSFYGRTYPLYYYVDRIVLVFPFLKRLAMLVRRVKYLANIPITVNLGDEILIIAKKK